MRYTILAIILVLMGCATAQERCAENNKWKAYGSMQQCVTLTEIQDSLDGLELKAQMDDYQNFQQKYYSK